MAAEDNGSSTPDEQFDARLANVFQKVLMANTPVLVAAAAQQALTIARGEIDQRIQDAKAEIDAYRDKNGATDEATAPQPQDTPQGIASTIRWAINSLPDIFGKSLDAYDKLVTIRMKQQDPFAMFSNLQKARPEMATFLAQLYAPDPLQTVMPKLLAKNSLDTANAVVRVMMQQGALPRGGRLAIDPFAEQSETPDEANEFYEQPTPGNEPLTAAMNKSRGPVSEHTPRASAPAIRKGARPTTLREALS